MNENTSMGWGGGIGFLAILFILIFAFRGNGWGNGFGNGFCNGFGGGYGLWGADGIGFGASSYGFQNYRATCDAEKAEIINTAATQYKTIEQAQLKPPNKKLTSFLLIFLILIKSYFIPADRAEMLS